MTAMEVAEMERRDLLRMGYEIVADEAAAADECIFGYPFESVMRVAIRDLMVGSHSYRSPHRRA